MSLSYITDGNANLPDIYDELKSRASVCDLFYKHQFSRNYYLEELTLIQEQN